MSLNSSYKLIETDDIIHILGFYSTSFFAKRKARKMNAGRYEIQGFHLFRCEVQKLGWFKYRTVALQNKLVYK